MPEVFFFCLEEANSTARLWPQGAKHQEEKNYSVLVFQRYLIFNGPLEPGHLFCHFEHINQSLPRLLCALIGHQIEVFGSVHTSIDKKVHKYCILNIYSFKFKATSDQDCIYCGKP